ncbi:hypothetical protein RE9431_48340 (plasmid) [Prescottella equi]|jgi:hypothetical protein|uniref:Uncharacterized protein n=1 Tax=Rhodococcus hoagii TaxID=43767 RepID=A0A0F6YRH0_RHOHA|nr:hypothetical protein [Prescottella equi]AKF15980.1 hypothetical protein pVAPN2012_0210 [Prescottella equi]AKG90480.1 hypothetical protein pVAPN_0210 [Prescottella equi]ARX59628.1 hypothetical protein pVAPN1204_0210 [Prescottella equi]ARX59771.1 hypothetical protein pVAPN1354_0210 [Prescottella equi]ARX59918.1 hypothetical protein pVAPN1557_0210 [Prescottella equi]
MTTATTATAIDPKTVDRALADLHARRWEIVDRLDATYRSIHHAIDDRQVTRSRWALTDIDAYERLVGLLDAPNPAPRLRDYAYLIDRVSQYRDERAVITAEIETAEAPYRANPWPRYYLVDRGHIHANPYCHTLRPSTRLGWLPDLSGDTEADAVTAHGPLLCTHCFPSAPVEWTVGPAKEEDPTMCSHKRMREWKTRGRYAWCGACGGVASVTSIGNLRKHKRPTPA